MFNKIKEWNENRQIDKTMKRTMRKMFVDYLAAQIETSEAEKKAYESMTVFSDTFKPEDLQTVFSDIHTVVADPKLTSEYYENVVEKADKLKVVK